MGKQGYPRRLHPLVYENGRRSKVKHRAAVILARVREQSRGFDIVWVAHFPQQVQPDACDRGFETSRRRRKQGEWTIRGGARRASRWGAKGSGGIKARSGAVGGANSGRVERARRVKGARGAKGVDGAGISRWADYCWGCRRWYSYCIKGKLEILNKSACKWLLIRKYTKSLKINIQIWIKRHFEFFLPIN